MLVGQNTMNISTAQFVILGIAAFVSTGILTWPVRELAIRLSAMDAPNSPRKMQAEPVPYLGGVAIALGITFTTFVGVFIGGSGFNLVDLAITVLIPALSLGILGLVDDLRSLSPWPRLITQTIVGTIAALIIVRGGTVGTPFGTSTLNTVVTIFWIVGICNSINFFDNLDGAASGAVAIAALGVFFIAFDRGQELVSALSIVTAGATIGFLMWNKSPAKIYMGDAGALFLGVIISVATIRMNPGVVPTWKSLMIPIMLMGAPILDTSVVVTTRILNGISPFTGGRDHISHILIQKGMKKTNAALSLWVLSAYFSLNALIVYFFSSKSTYIILEFTVVWVGLYIYFAGKGKANIND